MKILCDLTLERLTVYDPLNPFTCKIMNTVRNLTNGWRKRNEIVYATTGDRSENDTYPVDPDKFPRGNWLITGVFEIQRKNYVFTNEYEEAVKIFGHAVVTTNAYRDAPVWTVENGLYHERLEDMTIRDSQFWIHGSDYKTSWGCIINPDPIKQYKFAEICKMELELNSVIPFEVI